MKKEGFGTENKRNLKSILIKMTRSNIFFIFLWAVPLILTAFNLEKNIRIWLYALSSFMLLMHVTYGGYFLISKHRIANLTSSMIALFIWMLLFLLPLSLSSPRRWFLSAIAILSVALVFHISIMRSIKSKKIKQFCRYKMGIEILGIALLSMGAILSEISESSWIGFMNLLAIILINYVILFKRKLYGNINPGFIFRR